MAIQQRASTLATRLQSLLDRIISPQTRSQFYNTVNTFAREQPLLASFIVIHILISSTPLILFASFTLSVLIFSLVSALLFSLFWIGLALCVLVPTLFVTVGLGVGVWVWVGSCFVVARWVWGVLPASVTGRVKVKGEVVKVNGDGGGGKKVVLEKNEDGVGA